MIMGLLVLLLPLGCSWKKRDLSKKVVVRVGTSELRASQFSEELARKASQLDVISLKDTSTIQLLKKNVTADFITEEILENFARKNKLLVKKEMLEAEINSIRQGYPDDESFMQALIEQNLSLTAWTQKLRKNLLMKTVVSFLNEESLLITDQEIQQYFDQNRSQFQRPEQIRLRQIVLSNESDAQHILDELNKGKDFRELAREFSVAPEGFHAEGQLPWISKGVLDIFDQAFFLKKGQRSKINQSPYGYHIIELLDRRPAVDLSFKEARARIEKILVESKRQAKYSKWLEEQLNQVEIYKNHEFIDSIKIDHQLAGK